MATIVHLYLRTEAEGLVVHTGQSPVVCQERRLTYGPPGLDWTQSFASHGLCQPPFQHAPGESTSAPNSNGRLCVVQLYVHGSADVGNTCR